MTFNRALAILAVILFAVALVLSLFTDGNAEAIRNFTLGGFTSFAAAHVLP